MANRYPVLLPAIVIDSTNKGIRVTENATSATANIAEATYVLSGDGTSSDLLKAIKTAIEAATGSTNTYTMSLALSLSPSAATATTTITRATGTDTFAILWADALTTFDESLLGFANTNTANDANAKTSTLSPAGLWVGTEAVTSFEPVDEYAGGGSRAISGKVRNTRRGGPYEVRQWTQEMTDYRRTWSYENSSDPNAAFSTFLDSWGTGRFEFHGPDIGTYPALGALSSSTLLGTYHFDPDSLERFAPERIEPGLSLYDFEMRLRAYVA